ncbi:MAG TPA: SDR family NAD(P)-dependent oxidoreductase [Nitrospirota bacterium]|nr:SDR family NAD(P)-dependent oxidoreductase [Nitrospirota bacterium]
MKLAGKRLFDIVASGVGLVILSPLMLAAAAIVKLEDGGPAFFLQERAGRGMRPFRMFKFRTMRAGAQSEGPSVTAGGDPRVTRAGRYLRRYKLDELPQLVNVLLGEMSLVGPRPEVFKYVREYPVEFSEVLGVRPGITDYASIVYRNEEEVLASSEDAEELYVKEVLPAKLSLNLRYVKKMGFAEDLRIIMKTLSALYSGAAGCALRRTRCALRGLLAPIDFLMDFRAHFTRYRGLILFFFHMAATASAHALSFMLIYGGAPPRQITALLPYSVLLALAVRMPVFKAFGLHRGLWRYTGVSDMVRLFWAVTAGSAAFYAVAAVWAFPHVGYPMQVVVIDWLLTVALIGGFRLSLRLYAEYRVSEKKGRKVLLVGAGDAGEMIVRDMLKNPYLHEPVGFVDDDEAKKGLSIHGVPILGTSEDLPAIIGEHRPKEILIAIPSARPAMLLRLMNRLSVYKLPIKTLPDIRALADGVVTVNQIRPLELEDLLSRPPVKADAGQLEDFIRGKAVMVTGAGGSIGSEICRQALDLGAKAVIAYERHENSLYNLDMEVRATRPGAPFFPFVGDVNDRHRLDEAFSGYMPQIIYHAAAHKHVPMMEMNPREAIYNNVLGTRSAALAAGEHGADRFVMVSTDKAVNPTSVMGASKRACELIVRALNEGSGTKYITVRFGNVLGSSGSVVPLFREQIRRGGPVTVTHPDIERYLMLIPEAVQLVLQAASIGEGGEIFVLDMGEPMKIADLAKNMIMLSGFEPDRDIKIEYVGLRPGEKLYEELFDSGEEVSLTRAGKVMKAVGRDLPDKATVLRYGHQFEQCVAMKDTDGMLRLLCGLVSTYAYNGNAGAEKLRKAA